MSATGKVRLDMKPIRRLLKEKGLAVTGDVQRFHTANVLRRIIKYMPYRTGATIKLTQAPVSYTHLTLPTKLEV